MKFKTKNLFDEVSRIKTEEIRYYGMIITLFIISLLFIAFCVIDYVTDEMKLFYGTLAFAVVCLVVCGITLKIKKRSFAVSFFLGLVLFVYVAYSFMNAAYDIELWWICIIPICAPFIFGTVGGSITDVVVLAIILILKSTKLSSFLAGQTKSAFSARLIAMFVASMIIGLSFKYLQTVLHLRFKKLLESEREAAQTDALTGVKNRWWYSQQLEMKQEQPEYRRKNAIMLIDIDGFKGINDTYGHLFGDDVLIRITNAIKKSIGDNDSICRWGGDEFLCQISAASEAEACAVAEKLTSNVRNIDVTAPDGKKLTLGVSVGIVHITNPGEAISTEIFSMADRALYEAKKDDQSNIKVFSV